MQNRWQTLVSSMSKHSFFFQYCDLYLISLDSIVHLSYTIVLKMVTTSIVLLAHVPLTGQSFFWNTNINHWPNFGCDHHFYYWFRSIYTRRLDCRKNEFGFGENVPFGNACTQNKSILWTFCHTEFIYFQNKKGLISHLSKAYYIQVKCSYFPFYLFCFVLIQFIKWIWLAWYLDWSVYHCI